MTYQPTPTYTPGKLISAATTNLTVLKASPGRLGFLTASNSSETARFVKVYDKATAPVLAEDTPVAVFIVPGGEAGAGTNLPIPGTGLRFANGLALAITAGAGDTDATAVGAGEVIVNYGVK